MSAVETERRGDILVITLNRPDVRNAVNREMARGVAMAAKQLDSDPDLRAGVLTGAEDTFCSGMDLKAFAKGELPNVRRRGFAGIARRPPRKPTIAAVEGFALAGGFEVALSCDLIVAAEDAQFGIPEVTRGVFAAGGALFRLPGRVPYHVAMDLALTGNSISAPRAYEVGLVNRLAPPGGALDAALELASAVARNAPIALGASKWMIRRAPDWSERQAWRRQRVLNVRVFTSKDAREGARAFAEKREPVWKGR